MLRFLFPELLRFALNGRLRSVETFADSVESLGDLGDLGASSP